MPHRSKSPAATLAAAMSDLKEAAARRRTMAPDSPEYRAAVAAEVKLSQTVYQLTLALHRKQRD